MNRSSTGFFISVEMLVQGLLFRFPFYAWEAVDYFHAPLVAYTTNRVSLLLPIYSTSTLYIDIRPEGGYNFAPLGS